MHHTLHHEQREDERLELHQHKDYAVSRSDHCPFMETKTFCSNCRVHCYSPEMREQIRQVMRFSGPRMLLYHPVMALRHVIESKQEQKRLAQEAGSEPTRPSSGR